ncbi:MAG: DoxX family membrane protein [Bacteroidales bacterium]
MKSKAIQNYSNPQLTFLVLLRVLIGWHFLYEGLAKLVSPNWSSMGFLMDSHGFMAGFFHLLASNSTILGIVDFLNMYGLIAIGAGLILGVFTQVATIAGIVLLAFYYLSHPPLIGIEYALPPEGSYLWVNKTLIELFTLLVLFFFPTGRIIGGDRLIFGRGTREQTEN